MKALSGFLAVLILFATPAVSRGEEKAPNSPDGNSLPPIEEIVAKMVAQGQWQDHAVQAYKAIRRFQASNLRFKVKAGLDVRTTFRYPDSYDSVVLKQDGSRFIREHVFDKILDAEKEILPARKRGQYDIVPENYSFAASGVENCDGRKCYRLALSPKRKTKYLLEGFVWIDAEDYGITKIQGSPSQRLSVWTLRAELTRPYKRIGNVWVIDRVESASDLFIAGRSTLSIVYSYEDIQTDHDGSNPARSD